MVQSPRQLELYEKTVSVTMALENVLTAREISINYATCHLQGAKQYAGQLKSEMKCTQKRCRQVASRCQAASETFVHVKPLFMALFAPMVLGRRLANES